MKRIFTYLFSLTLLASTSFSFISCDDDDVETVMQIITALLTNGTADLENTAWYWQDAQKNGQVFAFKTGGQGVLYTLEKDVFTRADNFTYSYDSNQNVLTIAGVQYTVKSFTANQSLTLATNSGDVVLALADINSLPTVEQVNGTSNDDTDIAAMWAGTMWAIPVSESEYYVYSFETATTGKLYLTDANLDVKNQVTFTYQFGKVNDQYVFNIVRSDGQTETWVYVGLNEEKTQLTVKEGDGNTYTYTKAQSK